MGLSKEEAATLKRLQDKSKEPDAPQVARTLNVSIDLGDEAQVARAQKLGLLGLFDDEDGDGDGDGDGDEPPTRRGYFNGGE